MQYGYESGIVDGSTIFHLLGNYYEMLSGHVGQSLCGRMKGPVTRVGGGDSNCAACLDKAKKMMEGFGSVAKDE